MKDYKKEIDYKSLNNFVDYAISSGYDVDVFDGVLNDTYIIYNVDKRLSIRGVKARDYIILYPRFLNSWQNSFHILMTDNIDKLEKFLPTYENELITN